MKQVAEGLDIVARHEAGVQRARDERVREWTGLGTVPAILQNLGCERILPMLGPTVSPEELACRTDAQELTRVALRYGQCARCPAHGGECHREWPEGKRLIWDADKGFVEQACERWPTFKARQRLQDFRVGIRHLGCTLANYDWRENAEARDVVQRYLDLVVDRKFKAGDGLFLCGGTGTGKTHLAVAMLRFLLTKRMKSASFWYVPRLLETLRQDMKKEAGVQIVDMEVLAKEREMLILDDLGAERSTDWTRDQLALLIDGRYDANRPLIVTSNVRIEGLRDGLGRRSTSRLYEMVSEVHLQGPDRRQFGPPPTVGGSQDGSDPDADCRSREFAP